MAPAKRLLGFGFVGQQQRARGLQAWQGRRGRVVVAPTRAIRANPNVHFFGSRLARPLQPNRDNTDLFNKDVRRNIIQNRMGVNKHSSISRNVPFPDRLLPMFAISIRPTRFQNLLDRMGQWSKHVELWQGTLGANLDKGQLMRDRIVTSSQLKRGEIGCYDSHFRLWKHISDNNIPHALILEDDANIPYGQPTVDRINNFFRQLEANQLGYDLLYLGHNDRSKPTRIYPGGVGIPGATQGLFTYYVTLEGVRKLLANAIPMKQAVDDYVWTSKHVRQFTMEPRLNWVVEIEQSDTATIN